MSNIDDGEDFNLEGYEIVSDQTELVELYQELDSRNVQLIKVHSKLNKLSELDSIMKQQLSQNSNNIVLAGSEKQLLEEQVNQIKSAVTLKKQIFEQNKQKQQQQQQQQHQQQFNSSYFFNSDCFSGNQKPRIKNSCEQIFSEKEQQYEKQVQEAQKMVNQANNEKELALKERDEVIKEKNSILLINKYLQKEIEALKQSIQDYQQQTQDYQRKIGQLEEINQEHLMKNKENQSNYSKVISKIEQEKKLLIQEKSDKKIEENKQIQNYYAGKLLLNGNYFETDDGDLKVNIESYKDQVKLLEKQIESLTNTKIQLEEDLLKGQENLEKQQLAQSILLDADFDAIAQQGSQLLVLQSQIEDYEKLLKDMTFKTYLDNNILPQIERSINSQSQDQNSQRKILTQTMFINILNELKEVCYKRQLLFTFTLKK